MKSRTTPAAYLKSSGEQQESTPEDNGSEMEEAKLVDDTEDIMVEEEDIMG